MAYTTLNKMAKVFISNIEMDEKISCEEYILDWSQSNVFLYVDNLTLLRLYLICHITQINE